MTIQPASRVMSRWDAAAMVAFMVIGVVLALATVAHAAARIAEVLSNHDVRVFAQFVGTMADAPIGPDGALIPVELDSAYLIAPQLPIRAIAALVTEQVVIVSAVVTVVVCLLLLTWNVLHERVFSRTNTRLVTTAGLAAALGVGLAPLFGSIGADGAFAGLSHRSFNNVILAVDLGQLITVTFVGALAVTTFTVGDRLRRDTEGLV